jgi:3',5'-cyclic AMP phosphodiesterase CpdA
LRKLGVIGSLALAAIALSAPGLRAQAGRPAPTPAPPDPVLVGAGDISSCSEDGDEQTAALLDKIDGTVFTLGDNVYPNGTARQFMACYDPTWGRHKARTRPVPGNHDYRTTGAAGYFGYFGGAAGDPATGDYSYDLGTWHIIVLNSNCGEVGGCGPGSPQDRWLKADLAAHPAPCTAAMWHHPRYSSAIHGDDSGMKYIWRVLYDAGAELVLSGHDHTYERFRPQDADGKADPARGIRQFVVGTGGKELYKFDRIQTDSEAHSNKTFGVLKLTLHPHSYDWEFIPVRPDAFHDSGSADCH